MLIAMPWLLGDGIHRFNARVVFLRPGQAVEVESKVIVA
jgi:hypothetical protein